MKYLYKILLFFCNILLVLYNFSQNLPDIRLCIQHLGRFLFLLRYICRHFILLFAYLRSKKDPADFSARSLSSFYFA